MSKIDKSKLTHLERRLWKDEGYRRFVYSDSTGKPVRLRDWQPIQAETPGEARRVLTVGVGVNLEDEGITEEEALYLLRSKVKRYREAMEKRWPWTCLVTPVRRDVLTCMAFQMGVAGLAGFRRMLRALRQHANAYDENPTATPWEIRELHTLLMNKVCIEMADSQWYRNHTRRANEMIKVMRSGRWE